jgi:hypothetical protein
MWQSIVLDRALLKPCILSAVAVRSLKGPQDLYPFGDHSLMLSSRWHKARWPLMLIFCALEAQAYAVPFSSYTTLVLRGAISFIPLLYPFGFTTPNSPQLLAPLGFASFI